MFRRRKPEAESAPVNPYPDLDAEVDWRSVPPRLRGHVDDAIESFDRWRRLVGRHQDGPLKDRLDGWTHRLEGAVREIVATAVRVGEVEEVLATLDPDRVTAEYKAAKRSSAGGASTPELAALEARFASVQRMMNAVGDAEEQLRLLDVRLGAAVAQGAEIVVMGSDAQIGQLDQDIDGLVGDLDALRRALGEVGS